MNKLGVRSSLLAKAMVAQYTRSDGAVVQAHDNGRMAATQKAAAAKKKAPAAPAGGLKDSLRKFGYPHTHEHSSGRLFIAAHPDDGGGPRSFLKDKASSLSEELNNNGFESKVVAGSGGKNHYIHVVGHKGASAAKKPAAKKVGVSASVAKKAAPAAAKTGSEAPAKMVNVGSEKWPLHAKSSEKLAAPHTSGATHHVGGFKAPDYPAGGGSTDGDVTLRHEGKTFSFTGKKGKNLKNGEDSYEYGHHSDDGLEHRAWVTRSGHLMDD